MSANAPFWNSNPGPQLPAIQERWYLKVQDPSNQRSLWLQFNVLVSENGFKKVAETWALFASRSSSETVECAVKQNYDLRSCTYGQDAVLRIEGCELGPRHCKGAISSKGALISWDLTFSENSGTPEYELIPPAVRKFGLIRNSVHSVHPDLRVTGTTLVNGETVRWEGCPALQGHQAGPRYGHSWTWGHCNSFTDEAGGRAPFVFEGTTARGRILGPIPGLAVSSFHFRYRDQVYAFNSFKDPLKLRSISGLGVWDFQADSGELSFRGAARAEIKDFAGLVYEDTNGSLVYAAQSKFADLDIHIYRADKLEATYRAPRLASLEYGSRNRNPYLPFTL